MNDKLRKVADWFYRPNPHDQRRATLALRVTDIYAVSHRNQRWDCETVGVLRPVHTGDWFRRQFVAQFGDCCQNRRLLPNSAIWQQSPVLATVAELGDYSRQCGQAIRRLSADENNNSHVQM